MLKDIIGNSSDAEQIIDEIDKLTEYDLAEQDNNYNLEGSIIYKIIENTNINDEDRLKIVRKLVKKLVLITDLDEMGCSLIYHLSYKICCGFGDSSNYMYYILNELLDYSHIYNHDYENRIVQKIFTPIFLAYNAKDLKLLKILISRVNSIAFVQDMTANSLFNLSLEEGDKELLNILLEKHLRNQICISDKELFRRALETAITFSLENRFPINLNSYLTKEMFCKIVESSEFDENILITLLLIADVKMTTDCIDHILGKVSSNPDMLAFSLINSPNIFYKKILDLLNNKNNIILKELLESCQKIIKSQIHSASHILIHLSNKLKYICVPIYKINFAIPLIEQLLPELSYNDSNAIKYSINELNKNINSPVVPEIRKITERLASIINYEHHCEFHIFGTFMNDVLVQYTVIGKAIKSGNIILVKEELEKDKENNGNFKDINSFYDCFLEYAKIFMNEEIIKEVNVYKGMYELVCRIYGILDKTPISTDELNKFAPESVSMFYACLHNKILVEKMEVYRRYKVEADLQSKHYRPRNYNDSDNINIESVLKQIATYKSKFVRNYQSSKHNVEQVLRYIETGFMTVQEISNLMKNDLEYNNFIKICDRLLSKNPNSEKIIEFNNLKKFHEFFRDITDAIKNRDVTKLKTIILFLRAEEIKELDWNYFKATAISSGDRDITELVENPSNFLGNYSSIFMMNIKTNNTNSVKNNIIAGVNDEMLKPNVDIRNFTDDDEVISIILAFKKNPVKYLLDHGINNFILNKTQLSVLLADDTIAETTLTWLKSEYEGENTEEIYATIKEYINTEQIRKFEEFYRNLSDYYNNAVDIHDPDMVYSEICDDKRLSNSEKIKIVSELIKKYKICKDRDAIEPFEMLIFALNEKNKSLSKKAVSENDLETSEQDYLPDNEISEQEEISDSDQEEILSNSDNEISEQEEILSNNSISNKNYYTSKLEASLSKLQGNQQKR